MSGNIYSRRSCNAYSLSAFLVYFLGYHSISLGTSLGSSLGASSDIFSSSFASFLGHFFCYFASSFSLFFSSFASSLSRFFSSFACSLIIALLILLASHIYSLNIHLSSFALAFRSLCLAHISCFSYHKRWSFALRAWARALFSAIVIPVLVRFCYAFYLYITALDSFKSTYLASSRYWIISFISSDDLGAVFISSPILGNWLVTTCISFILFGSKAP